MAKGKDRGFVTYDEILKEFPHIEDDITFLDELYGKLSTSGIDVLEGGGMLDIKNEDLIVEKKHSYGGKSESSYDSIQMYLKEIGQYPLIPATEEKELARRIEKGDEAANCSHANLRLVVLLRRSMSAFSDLTLSTYPEGNSVSSEMTSLIGPRCFQHT